MKVGFTGTQHGMSLRQLDALIVLLSAGDATEFHHGDCIGADAQAADLARSLGIPVVVHPPLNPAKRAFTYRPGDQMMMPAPYLERNREIVDATEALVAAPQTDEEQLRSGTWSTIRYARQLGRLVSILKR